MSGLLDWRLTSDGVQIYMHDNAGQGWITTPCQCPVCGHAWQAVAAIGAQGIECPRCYEADPGYYWIAPIGVIDHRVRN